MHNGQILLHPLNIEYIHMNACLGYLKELILETISLNPDMSVSFKFAFIRSLSKILCIQNDLIAKCHIRDGDEYLNEPPTTADDQPKDDKPTAAETETPSPPDVSSPIPNQRDSLHHSIPSLSDSRSVLSAVDSPAVSREGFGRVTSSTASTTVSSDAGSISSNHQLTSEYRGAVPAIVSPFVAEHAQTFETTIWSEKGKKKGSGYRVR